MENTGIHDVSVKKERISFSVDPLWVADSSSSFHESMSNSENTGGDTIMEISGEEFGGCLHPPEKKRRLAPEQVQFLEKSFEMDNKLEPERKAQLAKEIGLQPRQVAIWFQNRRARYKTKLLEKEYGSLKLSYEKLKADYLALFKENEEMRNEINQLSDKMGVRREKGEPQPSDPLSAPEKAAVSDQTDAPAAATSARSDVVDSDSPHCREGNHSAQLEEPTADSSHVMNSEFTREDVDDDDDDDDSPCKVLLAPPLFPKLEFESHDDLQPNCCNLGFPVQNQGTWFWHY